MSDKNIMLQARQQVDMQKFVVRTPKIAPQMHPIQEREHIAPNSVNQSTVSSFRTARDELVNVLYITNNM